MYSRHCEERLSARPPENVPDKNRYFLYDVDDVEFLCQSPEFLCVSPMSGRQINDTGKVTG